MNCQIPDYPWILFLYLRHFILLTEDFMSRPLENIRIWGLLLKYLKPPAGKLPAEENPKLGIFNKKKIGSGSGSKKKSSGRVG